MLKDLIQENDNYIEIILPTTKKKLHLKRMRVKDKKEFLLNINSEDDATILPALEKLFTNLIKEKIKISSLSIEDLMYMAVELKKISEGNTIDISYNCNNCKAINETTFDLNKDFDLQPFDLKPEQIGDFTFNFIPMPYVKFIQLNKKYEDGIDYNFHFLLEIINKIVYKDQIYENFTKKDLEDFLNNLTPKLFDELLEKLSEKIGHAYLYKETTCISCKEKNILVVNDIVDFLKL